MYCLWEIDVIKLQTQIQRNLAVSLASLEDHLKGKEKPNATPIQ